LSHEPLSRRDLRGMKVTVMGLGLHGGGLSAARFLARSGAIVTVTDTKDEAALAASIEKLDDPGIRLVLGRHENEDFSGADMVIKNPAVRIDSPYLKMAKRVETDLSIFLGFTESPILAVTGSKGKSTTSSAIHFGLAENGYEAFLGGNITVSPLEFLDRTGPGKPVVLELSSWQLADLKGKGVLDPVIALLTSIMPDHMNRYADMDEYVADKRLIYAEQGAGHFTLCNRDDSYGPSFAAETAAKVLWYSERRLPEGLPGAWLSEGQGFCRLGGAEAESILPAETLVPGKHQKKNLLSAALALRAYGLPAQAISRALGNFPGVEHRLEFFHESKGLRFYNDTAATIPQAVEAAVLSFSSPIVLITGGTDKAIDFGLYASFASIPRRIVLLAGSGTEKLVPVLRKEGVAYDGPYSDFEEAVSRAISLARPGDAVLLSPGCASFGMFQHEFDRGNRFKEIVRRLSPGAAA
jgi:UDP-N-acetylmuramoylalanine--D-glutamate ligase